MKKIKAPKLKVGCLVKFQKPVIEDHYGVGIVTELNIAELNLNLNGLETAFSGCRIHWFRLGRSSCYFSLLAEDLEVISEGYK